MEDSNCDIMYKSYVVSAVAAELHDSITIKKNNTYAVVNYSRDCAGDVDSDVYRSVIFAWDTQTLLGFSPPRSISLPVFRERYPELKSSSLINEIVEGTMISLFYDNTISKWEIATKSAVSGKYYYYRNEYFNTNTTQTSTFRRMFIDALMYPKISTNLDVELEDIPLINILDKNYCYTFVLQHPDNHIVIYHKHPKVVLVAVYEIDGLIGKATNIPQPVYCEWHCFYGSTVTFPKIYTDKYYDSLEWTFGSIGTDSNILGVNITDLETGIRTKIENPAYTELRLLRGNNPNLQYQYLCLKNISKTEEFILNFPSYKGLFAKFSVQYNTFARNLHNAYISLKVLRNNRPISKKFSIHINNLHHKIYIPSLSGGDISKRRITLSVVHEYMSQIDPISLIYHLNFEIIEEATREAKLKNNKKKIYTTGNIIA
jgi:hypothetical protein